MFGTNMKRRLLLRKILVNSTSSRLLEERKDRYLYMQHIPVLDKIGLGSIIEQYLYYKLQVSL